jgi:hypothetical protein
MRFFGGGFCVRGERRRALAILTCAKSVMADITIANIFELFFAAPYFEQIRAMATTIT